MYRIEGRLSPKEILEIVNMFESHEMMDLLSKQEYYEGNNPYIVQRNLVDTKSGAPDWRVRVPYARKIINTVTGYMYKAGNVKYEYSKSGAKYEEKIDVIFKRNNEHIKTSQLGKNVSIYGYGCELFYLDNGEITWANADVKQIIPLYSYDIEPKLLAFIRFYRRKNGNTFIDVYYDDVQQSYVREKDASVELEYIGNTINPFAGPPLNVISNNEEKIGDFEPFINGGLIDAYDVLCSDSMNEFDRFAWAYLLLSDTLDAKDEMTIKQKRIFENLGKDGFAKFLTKDIPTQYIQFMRDWIKKEIHEQSHIPDFLEMSTGGDLSGVALERLLYDFEYICATKETYFKKGLYNRFKIIDPIVNISDSEFIQDDIIINMVRNKPIDNVTNGTLFNIYWGKLSSETVISNFAPFVEDPEAELEKANEESLANMEMFRFEEENTDDESGEGTSSTEQIQE